MGTEETRNVVQMERATLTLIISKRLNGCTWYVQELRKGNSSSTCSYAQGAKLFASPKDAWSYIRNSGYKKGKEEILLPIEFPLIQTHPFKKGE